MGSNRTRPPARALALALALTVLTAGGLADPRARAAGAVDEIRQGPKIGMAAASVVAAKDQTGARRDFPSLRGKRGLILMFSRSFDW